MVKLNIEKLKSELINNLLSPDEYLKIFNCLVENGCNELAIDVIKTANLTYPKNGRLKRELDSIGLQNENENVNPKVFCIGLSRTGTNSLSDALQNLGLSGKHWNGENSQILDWHDIEKFDYLSDTPVSFIFESLYYAYPNAHFIYTTRDVNSWAKSMENHFKWANGFDGFKEIVNNQQRGREGSLIREPIWGTIHKNLYTNANSWEDAYRRFDQRVKKFFSSQEDVNFLSLDVGLDDKEKWNKIANFLNIKHVPLRSFPRKNIKLQTIENQSKRELIDSIVNEDIEREQHFHTINKDKFVINTVPTSPPLELKLPLGSEDFYAFSRSNGIRKKIDTLLLENCYLSIDFSKKYSTKYYFFDNNKNYISDLSNGESPFISNQVIPIDSNIGFLEDKFSQFNICHLLLDKIPRGEILKDHSIDQYVLFKQNTYTKELGKKVGYEFFDFSKYSLIKKITFKFSRIYVTSSSSYDFIHPGNNLSQHVISSLSNLQKTDNPTSPSNKKKLFIDRASAGSRDILNKEDLYTFLEKENFIFIKPEDYSLNEQIELFQSAETVIGVHGAGLTNIAFCSEGTKVIELMPPLCGTNAFWKLATALKLDYKCIIVDDEELERPDYKTWKHQPALYNRRNVIIPIDKLELLI